MGKCNKHAAKTNGVLNLICTNHIPIIGCISLGCHNFLYGDTVSSKLRGQPGGGCGGEVPKSCHTAYKTPA
jgi:hypothetical protein